MNSKCAELIGNGYRQRGSSSIEFVLILIPLLMVFYLGFDLSRYLQIGASLDRHAYSLAQVASTPDRWRLDADNAPQLSIDSPQVEGYRDMLQGLLLLPASDANRIGVDLYHVSETAVEHQQAGQCGGTPPAMSGVTNAVRLLGAKQADEADRHVYAVRVCYRPAVVSFFQRLAEGTLLPEELSSFVMLPGRIQ
ncbi:Uncharacterised protein [BD1-7 clade bacterium]|uniref:Uncharacterized protein n=1 Tax=BD1-7 clade bacterium TaxID=2029982 RepID=A0A5S9NA67_9GAMM|nr:Uncharacterised protein [BD1-7 clade bacterium]